MTVSECCLTELLPYTLFEKYIYILALEMANLGNQHYAHSMDIVLEPYEFPASYFGKDENRVCLTNTTPSILCIHMHFQQINIT